MHSVIFNLHHTVACITHSVKEAVCLWLCSINVPRYRKDRPEVTYKSFALLKDLKPVGSKERWIQPFNIAKLFIAPCIWPNRLAKLEFIHENTLACGPEPTKASEA